MNPDLTIAPELQISQWLNTPAPINLPQLRGRVVVLHAFQMLCPGCVAHGLPQATQIRETFPETEVAVIGLHTVFEHHAVMNADALRAFVHEYRLSFPIGIDSIDMPSERGGIPKTMSAYELRGTPSLVLIDRDGIVRLNHFGRIDDMRVGAIIGQLVAQPRGRSAFSEGAQTQGGASCNSDGCAAPEST
jgi:peroxiredoxin